MRGSAALRWARLAAFGLLFGGAIATTGCAADPSEGWPTALPCDLPSAPREGPDGPAHFDRDAMLCIRLGMDESAAASMRAEQRFEGPPFGAALAWAAQCTTPMPTDYTWFEAELFLDGARWERVGIRKKGFVGSLSQRKPSLKLDSDRYVDGQRFGPHERVTLNNARQDVARFTACLAYDVFAAAGVRAPRCNLANVMLGAEALGPYVHIEAMDRRFLERAFGDASGDFYEGTVSDVAPGFLPADGLGHWDPKTNATDPSGAALRALELALEGPDEDLLERLAPHVNIKRFLRYWAVEVLIGHTDSYSAARNNFLIYFDPTDQRRATWIPWGADNVFRDGTAADDRDALTRFLHAELPRRLSQLPEVRGALVAEVRAVLAEAWDEDALLAEVDRLAEQVRSAQDDPDYDAELQRLRNWITARRARVQTWLDRGLRPGASEPQPCDSVLSPFFVGALFKDLAFGL